MAARRRRDVPAAHDLLRRALEAVERSRASTEGASVGAAHPLPEGGVEVEQAVLSPDGSVIALDVGKGVVVADARSGEMRDWIDDNRVDDRPVGFLPNGWLAAGTIDGSSCLYDWASHAVLETFPAGRLFWGEHDRATAYYIAPRSSPIDDDSLVAWDLSSRRQRGRLVLGVPRRGGLADGVVALPTSDDCDDATCSKQEHDLAPVGRRTQDVHVSQDGKLVVARWGHDLSATTIWDVESNRMVASLRGGPSLWFAAPAFTLDQRFVAVAAQTRGSTAALVTALVDGAAGGATEIFTDCSSPHSFAFSADSGVLAVGDIRRACVYDVTSRKLLFRSEAISPADRPEDDMAFVPFVRFIDGRRGLVMLDAGSFAAVVDVSAGRIAWKGWYGSRWITDQRASFTVGDGPAGPYTRLVTIDRGLRISMVPLPDAGGGGPRSPDMIVDPDEAGRGRAIEAVQRRTCHLSGWAFPREACSLP